MHSALLHCVDVNGKSVFEGRAATAFSNAEEQAFGTVDAIPFELETEIVKRGAKFEKASALWGVRHFISITAGNPY